MIWLQFGLFVMLLLVVVIRLVDLWFTFGWVWGWVGCNEFFFIFGVITGCLWVVFLGLVWGWFGLCLGVWVFGVWCVVCGGLVCGFVGGCLVLGFWGLVVLWALWLVVV